MVHVNQVFYLGTHLLWGLGMNIVTLFPLSRPFFRTCTQINYYLVQAIPKQMAGC